MWLLVACTRTLVPQASGPDDGSDPTTDGSTSGTDGASSTGDTGPTLPTTDPDCLAPRVEGPVPFGTIERIQTEEDFDFDRDGHLVAQHGNDLLGYLRDGGTAVVAPGIGPDAAGIRALTTGDFVVAQPDTGVVKLVDGLTGGSVNAFTDLRSPNGVEAGVDGFVYLSEFTLSGKLRMVEPYTGAERLLLGDSPINAIALSPDEQVLYVSSYGYGGGGAFNGIAALDREPDGSWNVFPREVLAAEALIQGLVTDKCGNLYSVESQTGIVRRYNLADQTVDVLANLGDAGGYGYGFFSSARFGPGIGGWNRTELYVTDRARIYVMDVGIEGRHVLAAD
ncbi:MAG: hypothetical protein ABMB14_00120 [Myxococcota bacterium]